MKHHLKQMSNIVRDFCSKQSEYLLPEIEISLRRRQLEIIHLSNQNMYFANVRNLKQHRVPIELKKHRSDTSTVLFLIFKSKTDYTVYSLQNCCCRKA